MTYEDWENGYPPAFRAYLLDQWPRGLDWVPPRPVTGSSLTGTWWKMHEPRHDGGIPPLLDGFVRQMDRGRQADELRHRGEMFTATADEVAAIIEQLRSSVNKTTKGRFAILRFFQFREIHPDLPDWCDEQGLHERTAYREVNRAVSAVWKYLVSRKRGYR